MLSGDIAAAYMYEPWITRITENLPGATSGSDTTEDWMLKTGISTDGIYMNGDFIKNHSKAAVDFLKMRFDAIGGWHDNCGWAI